MRKSAIAVFIVLLLAGTYLVTARDMNVHTANGVTSFDLADVDSITFSGGPEAGDSAVFALADSVYITMVWIPAGEFMMGAQEEEQEAEEEEYPRHRVVFENGFWMGKYELTQAQWEAVMESNPSNNRGDNLPVENMTWNEVQEFEATLNNEFRLPSEAEWEYACRAGTDTRFYWGDDPDTSQIDEYAWYHENADARTHEVGEKLPNSLGLHDMSGNVWEYCEDWYHENYEGAPDNGSAWIDGGGQMRIQRGGQSDNVTKRLRSAGRWRDNPDEPHSARGFRLVRDAD
ncbi:formylglycine-generating enzyme family protein [bacterium]|nr:formylglycine-generating enzyme family protein [bacterium]